MERLLAAGTSGWNCKKSCGYRRWQTDRERQELLCFLTYYGLKIFPGVRLEVLVTCFEVLAVGFGEVERD